MEGNTNNMNNMNLTPDFQNHQEPEKKKNPYLTKKMGAVIMALCIVAAGGGGFAAGVAVNGIGADGVSVSQTQQPTGTVNTADSGSSSANASTMASSSSGEMTVEQIADKVSDSVVEITTEVTEYDSFLRQYVSEGAGSGVILSSDGYIITNNHVIEGANSITVTLRDGTSYPATLVGADAQGDIAVIKVEATGLQAAELGSSADLKVGETVVAVGNPLGQLGGTVTDGIVSALDRQITLDGQTMTLLQTNAAINPGNSGGGLFNSQGQLIGVVVAKSSGSGIEGLGFAIPIDTAKAIADDLMQYGYVKGRISLGMSVVDVSNAQIARMYGLSGTGVYITQVTEGTNAAQVGFQAGDRIVSFNGAEITSVDDLRTPIRQCSVGDTVEMIIERNGSQYSGQLTLEESKPDTAQS